MPISRSPKWTQPIRESISPVDTVLRSERTISEEMTELRKRSISNEIIYFYVVDPQERLVGIVPTRALLLSHSDSFVKDIMNPNVVSINADANIGHAMELFAHQRLLAIPVVDKDKKLLGILDVRQHPQAAFDVAEASRSVEIFQLIGLQVQQFKHGSAFAGFRLRMPWLICNIIGGLSCALIGSIFQTTLSAVVILAMFIPLVLTLSEAISIQAMTLSLQEIHIARFNIKSVLRRLLNEFGTALLLGLFCALSIGLITLFWKSHPNLPFTVGLSIAASMLCAGLLGTGAPLLLHLLKLDPKVASGPFVLMSADIATTFLYLGLASFMLS